MNRVVNVIFHGVFGYVFQNEYIEAYTPAVCRHVYMAGGIPDSSCKSLLRGRTYRLLGVAEDPDQRSHPGKQFPVLPLDPTDKLDEFGKQYCKFRFPYPQKLDTYNQQIYPVDAFETGAIFAGKDSGPLNLMDPLPSSLIIVYPRNDEALRLRSLEGDSIIDLSYLPDSKPGITNVHIWCTVRHDMVGMPTDGHLRRAFAALIDIFPNHEVTIEIPDRFAPTRANTEALPPGVWHCDIDPDRQGCPQDDRDSRFGKTNCHYSNILFWPG